MERLTDMNLNNEYNSNNFGQLCDKMTIAQFYINDMGSWPTNYMYLMVSYVKIYQSQNHMNIGTQVTNLEWPYIFLFLTFIALLKVINSIPIVNDTLLSKAKSSTCRKNTNNSRNNHDILDCLMLCLIYNCVDLYIICCLYLRNLLNGISIFKVDIFICLGKCCSLDICIFLHWKLVVVSEKEPYTIFKRQYNCLKHTMTYICTYSNITVSKMSYELKHTAFLEILIYKYASYINFCLNTLLYIIFAPFLQKGVYNVNRFQLHNYFKFVTIHVFIYLLFLYVMLIEIFYVRNSIYKYEIVIVMTLLKLIVVIVFLLHKKYGICKPELMIRSALFITKAMSIASTFYGKVNNVHQHQSHFHFIRACAHIHCLFIPFETMQSKLFFNVFILVITHRNIFSYVIQVCIETYFCFQYLHVHSNITFILCFNTIASTLEAITTHKARKESYILVMQFQNLLFRLFVKVLTSADLPPLFITYMSSKNIYLKCFILICNPMYQYVYF